MFVQAQNLRNENRSSYSGGCRALKTAQSLPNPFLGEDRPLRPNGFAGTLEDLLGGQAGRKQLWLSNHRQRRRKKKRADR
jgi:hypothetical protein